MFTAPRRTAAAVSLLSLVAVGAVACTDDDVLPVPPYQLVFFDSCENAVAGLRAATKAMVTPYGLAGYGYGADGALTPVPPGVIVDGRADEAPAPGAGYGGAENPQQQQGNAPDHSGTNVHEAGVDEPDLVKTDGRRIVTVHDGRLSVVDVASRRLVGAVDLRSIGDQPGISWGADLLLAGNHALVLSNESVWMDYGAPVPADAMGGRPAPDAGPIGTAVAGSSVLLVDLQNPQVLSRARADGYVVDARQVGSTVRLVLRSSPRLAFPNVAGSDDARLAANRAVIDAAGVDAWAPRLEVNTGGETVRTQVSCDAISHPAMYSGANLLTVLSFDVNQPALGDGAPVSIVADGDTVYSNGTNLYVASNQAWLRGVMSPEAFGPTQPRTEIYRFDISTPQPRYAGGGSVPGQLINQYAMSEWDGKLRVASTSDIIAADGNATTQSGVYVLAAEPGRLVPIGAVEGLGKTERIYGVRFVGPVAYVVTFRQTDPLYTVDLRNPTAPVVRGELKIPGYSAYLHPVDDTRLIGVGQDGTEGGRALGTQVSLFDTSDISNPTRLARYTLSGAYSEAEVDPHAFLFWPATGLLVVPVQLPYAVNRPTLDSAFTNSGALVLRLHDDQISEIGVVGHPFDSYQGWQPTIQRSLVTVDGGRTTLWTVSEIGLQANDADTLARLAWIPL